MICGDAEVRREVECSDAEGWDAMVWIGNYRAAVMAAHWNKEKVMGCTSDYCDIHDYPVRGPWCAQSYANETKIKQNVYAPTPEQIKDIVRNASDELFYDLKELLGQRPRPRAEEKDTKEDTPGFKGFKI